MPDIMPPEPPALRVEDLTVRFRRRGIDVAAVNGVSFALARGETLTILGESGSGKSVSLKALMGLLPDYATIDGEVRRQAGARSAAGGTREAARRRDLDDLPGADGGARSGLYDRRADRRDDREA
jgi:ABC-type glutathione transport system ATPase component